MHRFVKTFIVLLVSVAGCFSLCSCGSKPSEEEMNQMYSQAIEYDNNAQFKEAMDLYRQLHDYGYNVLGYSEGDPDEALALKEMVYVAKCIACRFFESTIKSLKDQLKDPSSLTINKLSLKTDDSDPLKIIVNLDYSAKNGFGGMVRDTYTKWYTLTERQCETFYDVYNVY